jgi:porin
MHNDKGGKENMNKKQFVLITMLIALFGLYYAAQVGAGEAPAVKSYSGDFWTRSTLTGDWAGTRDEWAAKGITFDIKLTQIGQSVISGGKNQGWEYTGRGNIALNINTEKLGLWPGGFFSVEFEGNYNRPINSDSGAVMPANSSQLYPTPGVRELNVPQVKFTQFLSHYFGVTLGKFDTTSGDTNEFAHGKGDKQFFNLALNINPVLLLTVPNSTLGAGLIILPTKDPKQAVITMLVIDSNGRANTSGFDTAFEGNNTYIIDGHVRTDFFGMTGHQLVGATYSGKDFSSLDQQSGRFIIENGDIEKEDDSWSVFYNFDQYIYEPKKGQGIGIFGRFGTSDGDANPIHNFYSIGVGGKGVVPGRTLDEFGVGYYYIDVSNPQFTGPLADRDFLRDEYGIEAYYNIALTPWMKLTPDIQVIRPAQEERVRVDGNNLLASRRKDIDTATVVGIRLQVVF